MIAMLAAAQQGKRPSAGEKQAVEQVSAIVVEVKSIGCGGDDGAGGRAAQPLRALPKIRTTDTTIAAAAAAEMG